MFCLSCGKKISKISKFCKYCGSSQITKKKISKKEYEAVWTCDYCNTEFPSKKLSDEHETRCANNPKNKKFPFNTNPKKGWIIFWLTTITVFILTCFISAKFVDKGVTLLNGGVLLAMFLGNICLGIIAFLCIAFSSSKPKNNKLNGLIKYSLIICLVYLIINPSVLALEGYRATQNEEYKNKYYNKSPLIPTPTSIPSDYQNSLIDKINVYRANQKLNNLIKDDDFCKIAEKYVNQNDLSENSFKNRDDSNLCPKCGENTLVWTGINTPDLVIDSLVKDENIKKTITGKYKYVCVAYNTKIAMFVIGNKTTTNNNVSKDNSGNVECIGPDGKHFNTTMNECKKLAEKWGKTVDYMTNCEIHPDCGGGTVRISYSQCMKPCSGLSQKSNNNTQSNINNSSTNTSNKTAVFLTYGQYTIYCPSQNVEAVKSIDATMKSKSTEWAKNYNDCTSNFFKSDSCYISCSNINKSELDICYSKYGYSGSESKACTDPSWDNYSNCIKTCPSASKACDYVYLEQKNLSSQINTLCN